MVTGIIFVILLLIIFVPIKIKLRVLFKENKLSVYIYKFQILPKKEKKEEDSTLAKKRKKKDTEKKEKKKFLTTFLKKIRIKSMSLLDDLIYNKFKPKLRVKNNILYSLEDPALTAEIFGAMNLTIYSILSLIGLFLNLTPIVQLEPTFINKTFFDIEFESILSVSLAQIIVILFLVVKNIKFKGGVPLRG
jgi:hypothetical protein